ncbi:MAG: peptidase, partial [Gammaproteobacteria bacterium]|nr:peptidase [Gammaproteobacteria bacterium]
ANLVTTVWVGFDQPADLGRGEAGSKAALPIWVDYLQYALKDTPETALEKPDSIISTFVHKETGEIVPTSDPEGYEEFFVVGSEPPESTTAYPREPTSGARSVAAPGNLSNDLF